MLRFLVFVLILIPVTAFAQDELGFEFTEGTPLWALALSVMAVAAWVSAFVPEDKLPNWLRPIMNMVNVIGGNILNARNDPKAQRQLGGGKPQ